MSQAFHLLQLQKIDTQLDQIQSRLNAIDTILQTNEALKQAMAANLAADQQLTADQHKLRTAESAVQAQQIKIETADAALYSGKIRIPKELQDLQNDILSLKRRRAALEDEQIEAMLALEKDEENQRLAAQHLLKVQAETANQSASLLGEQTQLLKNQERLNVERQAVLPQIMPENIAIYTRLREQKHGLAVCKVEDNACAGCGSSLRPEEKQAARSPSQLVRCSSCNRFLYAG
jgi:predicted  nucleic acid-binding Zn-ribbon protein